MSGCDSTQDAEAADWRRESEALDPHGLPQGFRTPSARTPADDPDTVKE
jgi:hypothetical protein